MSAPPTRAAPLAAALLFAACARPSPETVVDTEIFVVDAPRPGERIGHPLVPVALRLTRPFRDAEVRVFLDEEPADDPLALVRPRLERHGGGVDLLTTVDLSRVEPGAHALRFEVAHDGVVIRQGVAVEWAPPPGRVDVRTVDEAGRPIDARVLALRDGQAVPLGVPPTPDAWRRDHGRTTAFTQGGAVTLNLDPGPVRLLACAGLRRDLGRAELVVEDGRQHVTLTLPVAVDDDRLAADLHVHTGRSADAALPDRLRVQSLAASGLDAVVISDHNAVTDLSGRFGEAVRAAGLHTIQGAELAWYTADRQHRKRRSSSAHLNAFPLAGGDVAPLPPLDAEALSTLLGAVRTRGREHPAEGVDAPLLQVNHPRGIHFQATPRPYKEAHALFRDQGYDPVQPLDAEGNRWLLEGSEGARAVDLDAVELFNRASLPLYREVRRDWFSLLNQGVWWTGTGNSDSHAADTEVVGFPLNLIDAHRPALGEDLDVASVVDALRGGRVTATTGPVLDLSVGPAEGPVVGPGAELSQDKPLVATVRVQAAAWVPVDEVRLVVDGAVVHRERLGPQVRGADGRLDRTLLIPLPDATGDGWVLAEAGWPLNQTVPRERIRALGPYARFAPKHLPLAFTNPVRLDRGGDGAWTPALGPLSRPDAARPDAARPDAARPDAARPDAARPDAARPDAARPDAARPEEPPQDRRPR